MEMERSLCSGIELSSSSGMSSSQGTFRPWIPSWLDWSNGVIFRLSQNEIRDQGRCNDSFPE